MYKINNLDNLIVVKKQTISDVSLYQSTKGVYYQTYSITENLSSTHTLIGLFLSGWNGMSGGISVVYAGSNIEIIGNSKVTATNVSVTFVWMKNSST